MTRSLGASRRRSHPRRQHSAAVFIVCALSATVAQGAQRSLQAIVELVANNPAVHAALAEERAAQGRLQEARGAAYPRLNLTSFVAPSPEIRCVDAACTQTSPREVMPTIAGVFAGMRLEAAQPLYTFGKIDHAIEAASEAQSFQAALTARLRASLELETARAYYGLGLARALGSMLEEGATQLDRAKASMNARLSAGDPEVTVQDRLRLEAFAAEVQLRLSETREKGDTALQALRALAGEPDLDISDDALGLAAADPGAPPEEALHVSPATEYLTQAQTSSPELQAAQRGLQALEKAALLERARYWPDVLAVAAAGVSRAGGADDAPSAFANDPFNANRAELALVLRWNSEPVMQQGRVARAEAERDRGRALAAVTAREVEFQIRDAHQKAERASERFKAARAGERSARGWLTSVLQADAIGTASARDLADAYLAYFTLRTRTLQSAYEWKLARAMLARQAGEHLESLEGGSAGARP